MNATWVRPGPHARRWLDDQIAELKAGDPLAPVTVVVASNHIGLATRRSLARTGYANVRFGVLGRLVEPLGAPALAAAGWSPLTAPAEEAAVVQAVRRKGQGFGAVGAHPSLVRTLRDLFRELRAAELDDARLGALVSGAVRERPFRPPNVSVWLWQFGHRSWRFCKRLSCRSPLTW